jgi:hypothetical protein
MVTLQIPAATMVNIIMITAWATELFNFVPVLKIEPILKPLM